MYLFNGFQFVVSSISRDFRSLFSPKVFRLGKVLLFGIDNNGHCVSGTGGRFGNNATVQLPATTIRVQPKVSVVTTPAAGTPVRAIAPNAPDLKGTRCFTLMAGILV